MKAERNPKTDLIGIDGVKEKFKRFDMGIGWLDPKGDDNFARHWLVVVGQQENNEYVVAHEASGTLVDVASAAVDAKDRFLVERCWLDATVVSSSALLQSWDGLTEYKYNGYDQRKKKQYLHKPEHWSNFRNRDTTLTLFPVPALYRADFQSCVDLFVSLLKDKRLSLRKACPMAWKIQGESLETLLTHPIMKAIAWPLKMMEEEQRFYGGAKTKTSLPRYGNLRH